MLNAYKRCHANSTLIHFCGNDNTSLPEWALINIVFMTTSPDSVQLVMSEASVSKAEFQSSYDNVPNLALLLKSWINACFKSLTWPVIQTATGLTGLLWLPVISCRVLQVLQPVGDGFSSITACVSPACTRPRLSRNSSDPGDARACC